VPAVARTGEDEDVDLVTAVAVREQRAAAAELDVARVGPDGQHTHVSTLLSS
jgi:hypothetical protein